MYNPVRSIHQIHVKHLKCYTTPPPPQHKRDLNKEQFEVKPLTNLRLSPTTGQHMTNKAIRDGKYLARHMPVLGNVHLIKIENVDIFFVTSFLCSLEFFILLIDTATQEVPMKNI